MVYSGFDKIKLGVLAFCAILVLTAICIGKLHGLAAGIGLAFALAVGRCVLEFGIAVFDEKQNHQNHRSPGERNTHPD